MFSFFKSSLEKDLIKLGFGELVNGYKQKLKNKEWSKQQYHEALKDFHSKHKNEINNINNVNVATRQSFDVTDTIVPLNLQNIQQEYIDIDFIYSSLLFEYNNHKRIHSKAINELEKILIDRFPNAMIDNEIESQLLNKDIKFIIDQASLDITNQNKNVIFTAIKVLKSNL